MLLAMLVGSAASASADSAPIHGRGPKAQAEMYAIVLDNGQAQIQVRNELCIRPRRAKECTPAPASLRRAVQGAVDRPVLWVRERRKHEGDFWVLSPIRWAEYAAAFRYTWSEPGKYGCDGGGRESFVLRDHEWVERGSTGYAGCP